MTSTYSSLPGYLGRLLSLLSSVEQQADGWLARCPCPGHGRDGDQHPSLRVTVGEEGRILIYCRGGCETTDVLVALGLSFADLWPTVGEEPATLLAHEPVELTEAQADLHHAVYTALLEGLGRTSEDNKGLRARGLSDDAIPGNGYASYCPGDDTSLVALWKRFGDRLYSVPGFRPAATGHVRFCLSDPSGLFIPCRDRLGRIVAIKVRRRGDTSPKYVSLSGAGSPSSAAALHHPLQPPDTWHPDYIRITEGELKADVTSHVTRRFTLGLPGVGLIDRILPWLAEEPLPPAEVRLALDWPDVCRKRHIFDVLCRGLRLLREAGYPVALETWDGAEEKGIDDLFAAGKDPVVLRGEAIDARLEELRKHFGRASSSTSRRGPWDASGWTPCPFPVEALPPSVAEFVQEVALSKQAPVDYPGVAALAVAAVAAGATRRLLVKGDWLEFPCLYMGLVAEPGGKKTPSTRPVMAPVRRRQLEAILRSEEDSDTPVEHTYTTDFTVESVNAMLATSPRGLLVFKDEMISWVLSDNQYRGGKGADRQYWLSAWSSDSVKVDRKTAKPTYLSHPFICVLGGIQPDMLSGLADRLQRQDGFVDRLLIAYPAEDEEDDLSEEVVSLEARDTWERLIDRLYSYSFRGKHDPHEVRFSSEAYARWREWYRSNQAELKASDFPAHLKGPWKKMKAYSARIALVLRLMAEENDDGLQPITADDVERAILLVDYFKQHAVGTYARLQGQRVDEHLDNLKAFVISQPERTATVRQVMRAMRLATRKAAMDLLQRAVDLDIGEMTQVIHPVNKRRSDAFMMPLVRDEEG